LLDVEIKPMRAVLVLMALLVTAMNGQESLERLRIEPYGTARSRVVTLEAGNIIRVASDREGELNPAIFIFESTEGLVAKNDEDSDAEGFDWTAPRAGQYRLVIYSRSSHPLEYQITRFPLEPTRGPVEGKPSLAIVPVFYATNRTLLTSSPVTFGSDPTSEGELRFGKVEVSIPLDHRMGNLEYPSFLRVLDPAKHFVAKPAVQMNKSDFYGELAALASRSDEHDCLVFVHGFNVSFDDASLRVAQLAYDLGFKGPAVLFTWPSQGKLLDYLKDGRNADLSAGPLKDLLLALSQEAQVRRIHVIAHSMGNRVLATALTKLGPAQSSIREIALMAPDIDAALFKNLAREFSKGIGPIALYASSQDKALAASEHFAGYTRAGQGGKNMVIMPGIESIDASAIDTSTIGLGHSYYGDSREILADLYWFFRGQRPDQRFALRPSPDRRYWIFAP
jgi:esterase/lipase superfamily enzyme